MSRYEVQVDPVDLPKKSKPDEEPHVPAQQNELKDGETDEDVPITGGSEIPIVSG